MTNAWQRIEAEARGAYLGAGRFPLRAYSELMPPPYVGLKPYAPLGILGGVTDRVSDGDTFDIDEYEQAQSIGPGLDWITDEIMDRLQKLVRGGAHGLSRTLLDGNPAWPPELAEAARAGRLGHDPLVVVCPLALSRTQDDKGNDRWTLFGTSHDGPAASFLHGLDDQALEQLLVWADLAGSWRILADETELPESLRGRMLGDAAVSSLRVLVTFRPFTELPGQVRAAYLAGTLALVPTPASLVLFEHAQILEAASCVDRGGRFGYRMYYPPMRVGTREVFWHLPVIARADHGRYARGPVGYLAAEAAGAEPIGLRPRLLTRPPHLAAARAFPLDPGHSRHTTSHNIRKLLDTHAELDEALAPGHARALLHVGKDLTLEDWLAALPAHAADAETAAFVASTLREATRGVDGAGPGFVLDQFGTRAFAEQVWTMIAELAHGAFRQKNDADGITVNRGKHGGPAAKAAGIHAHQRNDLEELGDHLHARYRELIAAHDMVDRAEVVDHVFRWKTDFEFPWMGGWAKNQEAPAERNVVLVIPGNDRSQAVVMGDHYDTAYMEDVYYPAKGGDLLRAPAFGADDNHSATTALLLAAEHLLPLARAGKLERDVWLVHLTGEEYPADCMGARALCQHLVERHLVFTAEDGSPRDVSQVDVVAAFILDMIGHNTERARDVFQIASGEGAAAARLARRAHHANVRWNERAAQWNATAATKLHRAERVPDSETPSPPPPPFAHLEVRGEIRVEWESRSALFNTDGQIFSDVGIPAVLFMENYDISRKGYHDTLDTMANIDLDYCVAVIAIAIETVVDTACARDLG